MTVRVKEQGTNDYLEIEQTDDTVRVAVSVKFYGDTRRTYNYVDLDRRALLRALARAGLTGE